MIIRKQLNVFPKIYYFLFVFLLSLSAINLISNQQTSALSGADFNPARIIDDNIFYNSNSMNATQIQQFLNAKVPTCDTNGTAQHYTGRTRAEHGTANGAPPPYTCLKNYSQSVPTIVNGSNDLCTSSIVGGTKTAAQIIHDAAKACNVNPQVLITVLQKEQSLITDDWPWPIQYRSATGYGCPDTAPCDSEYYGFFNQVYQAAKAYKRYRTYYADFNYRAGRSNTILWHPNGACGTSNVNIQNQATAGLYIYTPYRPNQAALNNLYGTGDGCSSYGNRNFWRIFNDWFGSSVQGVTPIPVYKNNNDNKLYAVWDDKKYYIPTWDVMIAWGFHKRPITTVYDNYLNDKVEGEQLTNIIKTDNPSSSLYLLDDGKRYPVPYTACIKDLSGVIKSTYSWGLDCFNSGVVKTFPELFVNTYTAQDITLPEMIAFQDSVWKLENGKKRRIVDQLVIDVLGGWGKVRWMKDLSANQPQGKIIMRNGYLVKFSNSPQVYLYDNNRLNPVPSMDVLLAWGLHKKTPLHNFQSSINAPDPLPIGQNISYVTRNTKNNQYYLIDNGYKMSLSNVLNDWPLDSSVDTTDGILNLLPTIPLSNVYKSDYGTLFTIYNKKKYFFATLDDFYALGFKENQIRRLNKGIEYLPGVTYGGMHLSNGRLYKASNNLNQIYLVSNSKSLKVNSISYPGLPYNKLITVDITTAARYPTIGDYQPL